MNEAARIPWGDVASNFIWILGAAIILAAFSIHQHLIQGKKSGGPNALEKNAFKSSLLAGLGLVFLGLGLAIGSLMFAAIFIAAAVVTFSVLINNIKKIT